MTRSIGKKRWAIAAGRIPLAGTGPEPEMTSRDELRLLNTGSHATKVEILIYYGDAEPVGPYAIDVPPRRVRRVRVNDLIDPLPVPLETDYSLTIQASHPIVVQFTKVDTGDARRATMGSIAYS
jgi:hypothetical protein